MSDDRVLIEAAQRDPSQFADLYERHFERVYAFVLGRVRDRDAAEDVTADVFHRALGAIGKYEFRGAPFGAWLIRIAANAIVDRAVHASRERGAAAADRGAGAPGVNNDAASAEPPADDELQRADERARLFQLVDELPHDQRSVIVERFVHERSIRAVAARLGKSEGAIKQLQLRAIHQLRVRMGGARG